MRELGHMRGLGRMDERGQGDDSFATYMWKPSGRRCVEDEMVMCVRMGVWAEHHEREGGRGMCHFMLISHRNRVREKKGVNEIAWIESVSNDV